jgi:hypothetical protein
LFEQAAPYNKILFKPASILSASRIKFSPVCGWLRLKEAALTPTVTVEDRRHMPQPWAELRSPFGAQLFHTNLTAMPRTTDIF